MKVKLMKQPGIEVSIENQRICIECELPDRHVYANIVLPDESVFLITNNEHLLAFNTESAQIGIHVVHE